MMARQVGFSNALVAFLHHCEAQAVVSLVLQAAALIGLLFVPGVWHPSSTVDWTIVGLLFSASYALQRWTASGWQRRYTLASPLPYPLDSASDDSKTDLDGESGGTAVAIVTGGNTGIGLETAAELLRRGLHVILACRSPSRGRDAVAKLQQRTADVEGAGSVVLAPLDLSSQKNVRSFVETALPAALTELGEAPTRGIDLLVNNAGIFTPTFALTEDGIETTLAANYVSAFLLTELLLPAIKRGREGKGGRVVCVASVAHQNPFGYDRSVKHKVAARALEGTITGVRSSNPYGLSKMCNVMHATYLAEKHGIEAFSVHPGGVLTEVFRRAWLVERVVYLVNRLVMKTPLEGAQTTLHCCLGEVCAEAERATVPNGSALLVPGGYYADCRLADDARNPIAADPKELEPFIEWSRKAAGLASTGATA